MRLTGSEIGRVASGARRGEELMTKAVRKITLCPSRDIAFDKLMLSQSKVRRIKAGVSVEEQAEVIARRRHLQSLSVRPVLGNDGIENGNLIPDGYRRFQAVVLLVEQKRSAKTTHIPYVLRNAGSAILAEDDSLAGNMQRAFLPPLVQFRAFVSLREKGLINPEIAVAFFVTPQIVKWFLKLASAAPALLEVCAEDSKTLEQLTAFAAIVVSAPQT